MTTVLLLIGSNLFMTTLGMVICARYVHNACRETYGVQLASVSPKARISQIE
jgi:uncharacterized protein (DUF486 family)